jgi:hypothetical protein
MEDDEARYKEEKRKHQKRLNEYKKTIKHTLTTTRFNSATYKENLDMRLINPSIKCIYGCPMPVSSKIQFDTNLFVLEMNNDYNIIMGIGLVRNHPITGKYLVYEQGNYNRYIYAGRMRIDRMDMNEEELIILKLLEGICFKGVNHSKRGQGIVAFPVKLQYKCDIIGGIQLTDYVCQMFKTRQNI